MGDSHYQWRRRSTLVAICTSEICRFIRRASSTDETDPTGAGQRNGVDASQKPMSSQDRVDHEEFLNWVRNEGTEQNDPLRDAFTLLDSDNDGFLSKVTCAELLLQLK